MITDEIIENFIKCKYKAYLKFNHQLGNKTEFECLESDILEARKAKFHNNLRTKFDKNQLLQDFDFVEKSQVKATTFVIEPFFCSTEYDVRLDAIEISPHKSSPQKPQYIPIQVSPKEKISKIEKFTLCLKCLIVSRLANMSFEFGKIIYGQDLKTTRFGLDLYEKQAKKSLVELAEIINGKNAPVFYQNTHCSICEFQELCRNKLIEKDDLSLLGKISPKEIIKQNSKGIFTIHQLSYTFKPRRQRKEKDKSQRFLWALKALALREKKTYILEVPKLSESKTEIYLDIEALPEENFNYLIGLIIRQGKTERSLSFWADSKQDEQKIFGQLFSILSKFSNFIVYHYGNYEIQALKKINKKTENEYEAEVNQIIEKSNNLLSSLYYNVYPPIYSNGLKDVAEFLGFRWSDKNASGIQSIVWRKRWELSGDPEYEEKLIQYNMEDCAALKLIKDWLVSITEKLKNNSEENFVKVETLKSRSIFNFGRNDYQTKDFDVITQYAHFDYQREKIYLKTNRNIQKAIEKKKSKELEPITEVDATASTPFPAWCPNCGFNKLDIYETKKTVITDLKFFGGGIKKWIILFERRRFKCHICGKIFTPTKYKYFPKYGHNLTIWCIDQHISYGIGCLKIENILQESFNVHLPEGTVYEFKSKLSQDYRCVFERIKQNMLKGSLIHADETRVSIKGISGYVWVFTNIDSVFYIFRPTRNADFLKDLLKEFEGILVSDFYTGYDSMPCEQQKCIVHLIRDLNDDLFKNQFDLELKQMVTSFGKMFRRVVNTIDQYGLKKEYLNKHNDDVEAFYREVVDDIEYESEFAVKYQNRFKKYRDKLFVFLDYDGIPWNNNNAEHAIKAFATYRRKVDGLFTESSISEYLALLSIQQTCRYRGISFLEFLKSGEKSIKRYSSEF